MDYKEEIKQIIKRIINLNWNRIFGFLLLFPPLYSVFAFLLKGENAFEDFENTVWTGLKTSSYSFESSSGHSDVAYTSALPLYFGLMAIAASILLSNSNKK